MADIIKKIIEGSLTLDEAYDEFDRVLESDHGGKVPELLGLTKIEYTANCHSVGLDELAEWRKNGWPNKCAICGKKIVIENWGWFAREINDGESHELVHIDCMD